MPIIDDIPPPPPPDLWDRWARLAQQAALSWVELEHGLGRLANPTNGAPVYAFQSQHTGQLTLGFSTTEHAHHIEVLMDELTADIALHGELPADPGFRIKHEGKVFVFRLEMANFGACSVVAVHAVELP